MAGREREVSFSIRAKDEYSAQMKAAREAVDKLRASQERKTSLQNTIALKKELREVEGNYKKAATAAAQLASAAKIKLDSSAPTEADELYGAFHRAQTEAAALKAEVDRLKGALRGAGGGGSFAIFSQSADEMRRQAAAAREAVAALRERQALATRGAARIGAEPDDGTAANRLQANAAKMKIARDEALRLNAAYDAQRQQVALLGRALAQADAPTEAMVSEFERAKTALAAMRAEMRRVQTQSAQMQGGFAKLARTEAFMSSRGSANSPAAQEGWWARMAAGITGSAATAHGRGPLGLRPYELQNLGYQVNDLITQVASGTPVMQAFAQQGGQIAQIFPKATTAIIRFIPQIAAISAVVLPVIAAIKRLNETGDMVTDFGTKLAASVDGSRYDPAQLTAMVRELERVGIAADASRGAIVSMMQEGLDPERMQAILLASRDFAAVWGMEIPEAASTLQSAFDGTYDGLKKLDDQYNFLTAAQRTHLRELYEQGRALEATRDALEIFSDKMGEAADLQEGPWSEASHNLAVAWRDLLDWIGTTAPIQAAIGAVNALASVVAALTGALNGLDTKAGQVATKLEALSLKFAAGGFGALAREGVDWLFGNGKEPEPPAANPDDFIGPRVPTEKEKKAAEDAEIVRREATLKALEGTGDLIKKANEKIAEDRRKAALKGAQDAGKILDDANKELEKQQQDHAAAMAAINQQIADAEFDTRVAGMSEREGEIQKALRRAEQTAARGGIELTQEQRDEIIRTTGALYDQEQAAKAAAKAAKGGGKDAKDAEKEKQKALEDTLDRLVEQRRLLMESVEYYQDNGQTAAADRLREQVDGVNERIKVAITNLRAFWAAAGGLEGETELLRLDDLERQINAVGEGAVVTRERVNSMIADGAADAMDDFAQSIASGENAIDSFGRAFLSMAADFLREIAMMILRQAVFNALQNSTAFGGGGIGGIISGAIGALVAHSGTEASGTRTRVVPAAVFANAPRYHNGTSAAGMNLAADEQAAILRKGEAVLTEDDPYHPKNRGRGAAGRGGGTTLNAKIVNVIDPAEVMQQAMSDEAGQEVIINWMSSNRRRIKSVLE